MDPSLYEAAAKGEIDALKHLKNDLHLLLTPNKNTVLHIHITAAECPETESCLFVNEILDMCPSLLLQANAKGQTPLHMAARYAHSTSTVKLLINRAKALHDVLARQMLRMTTNDKDTALHEAVRFNNVGVVCFLTEQDPDFPYSANAAGETPLYVAAARRFFLCVFAILQQGQTCPPYGGPNARTALHAAVIWDDQGVANLLSKGPLTKEADQQGWTPLHYAVHLGHVSMVTLLLKSDRSVAYFPDRDGNKTCLHIAAGHGHSVIMKELISRCPDCCELADKRGWNVLHFAVDSGDEQAVQVVLENSRLCNIINEKDNDGNTPLHRLCASLRYIPTLIKHPKVDRMALNNAGLSPLDVILANESSSEAKGFIVRDLKEACDGAGQHQLTCGPT